MIDHTPSLAPTAAGEALVAAHKQQHSYIGRYEAERIIQALQAAGYDLVRTGLNTRASIEISPPDRSQPWNMVLARATAQIESSTVFTEFEIDPRMSMDDVGSIAAHRLSHYITEQLRPHLVQSDRLPVYQRDRHIGTLPNVVYQRSTNPLYDVRTGDITRNIDKDGKPCFIADRTLGPGDIAAIDGFMPA